MGDIQAADDVAEGQSLDPDQAGQDRDRRKDCLAEVDRCEGKRARSLVIVGTGLAHIGVDALIWCCVTSFVAEEACATGLLEGFNSKEHSEPVHG